MYLLGQKVIIEIRDPLNIQSPKTVLRGEICREHKRPTAKVTEPHPVWFGAVLTFDSEVRIRRDWQRAPKAKKEPPADLTLKGRWGVRRFSKPVLCSQCRTLNVLATPRAPRVCLACRMGDERKSA